MAADGTPATLTSSGNEIPLHSARGRWVIAAMALGSGMIFLDGTVVNVALPRIQSDLAAPVSGLQWILNGYLLLLAAVLLLGGSLGDRYGRKWIFVIGLGLFTLASIACGIAPNLIVLVLARVIQGLGGALLVPGSLAMIRAVIASDDAGEAIGTWAGLSGVTTAAGPLLGGYLVQASSWRAIFFLNVPVAAVTVFALRHVPENRDPQASGDLDWIGALLTVVGLGGLMYALIEGPDAGWTRVDIMVGLGIGMAGILAFILREARTAHPMMPLGVFRSRNFTGANLATVGVYFSLTGALLFLALDLQQIQGYSPLQAGAATLPITVLLLFLSPRVGGLMRRFGARLPMTAGAIIIAVGYGLLALSGRHVVYLRDIFPGVCVVGIGMSIFVTPLTTTVMSSVPQSLAGIASGINNAVTRVCSLLAVAILGIVILARFEASLTISTRDLHLSAATRSALLSQTHRLADDPIPARLSPAEHSRAQRAIADAYIDGYRWVIALCAFLCLGSAAFSFAVIHDEMRSHHSSGESNPGTGS